MMIIYIARTLLGNVALLADPQKISTTTIIIYLLLAIFFGFGYSYNIIYNIVYGHCDKLVESTNRAGLMIDQIYNGLMIVYAIVSSIYLYQRSLYHSHTDLFDVITTNIIDSVSAVLFVKSIVYKSYLGQPVSLNSIVFKTKN
uniref:Gustatory receptor n=1 Tax=Ditylenchus dipsaci TaxID=166011 RepID=A0A915DZN9_9BILA